MTKVLYQPRMNENQHISLEGKSNMTENNTNEKIQELIDSNDVFLFMKGFQKLLNVVSQDKQFLFLTNIQHLSRLSMF